MKKLPQNKVLIYDDNCPLCKAYTKAFVKGGFLREENRISFSNVNMQQFKIDWQKAKHEIPLVNIDTGEVKYGVDALVDILRQKIPFIPILLKIKWLNWFLRKLYKLISYNRKIIVAKTKTSVSNFDCTPDYNFFYRRLLTIICFFASSFFLYATTKNLLLTFSSTTYLIAIVFLFLIIGLITWYKSKKIATEILAHSSIVLLIISFLLFVASIFQKIFLFPTSIFYFVLSIIFLVMVLQIKQRIQFIAIDDFSVKPLSIDVLEHTLNTQD